MKSARKMIVCTLVLMAGALAQVQAQAAFCDSMNSFQSSQWEKADWANGNPFNCGWLPDHITHSNGEMVIKLDNVASHGKSYSSCEYRSKTSFSYGSWEARMKTPPQTSGVVNCFVGYDNTSKDEIDFEFLCKNTKQVQVNYYINGTGGHEYLIDLGFDASADYHVYKFEWSKTSIKYYVDGTLKHTVTGTMPSHSMQMMPALWNGTGVDSWLGAFNYQSPLYSRYDYIKYDPPKSSSVAAGKKSLVRDASPMITAENQALSISLSLASPSPVKGELLSLSGKTLLRFDFGVQNVGEHTFSLPLQSNLLNRIMSGSFLCSVQCQGRTFAKKVSCF